TAISGDGEFINWGEVEEQASSQLSFNVRVTSNEGTFVADDNITFNAPAAFNGGAPANGQNANLAGTGRILFSSNFWVDGDTTSDVTTLDLNGSANVDAAFTVDGDIAFNGGVTRLPP